MSSTTPIKQMKLFGLFAAASVIGSTLISANPAKAGSYCTVNHHGAHVCVTAYGSRQAEITVDNTYNETGYIMFINCNSGNWRVRANTGYSRSDLNNEARKACSFI